MDRRKTTLKVNYTRQNVQKENNSKGKLYQTEWPEGRQL